MACPRSMPPCWPARTARRRQPSPCACARAPTRRRARWALPAEIGKGWTAEAGCEILDGIGSTEMLHICLSNRPGEVRYGTTGKAVPGYELRIVGDDGQECG